MRVSVVVPTYNRGRSIGPCLEALRRQTHGSLEIIVSDDCSTDRTAELAAAIPDPRILVVRAERNGGPAAARNRAVRQASAPIVFFTDDDVLVPPDWIETGLRYFEDPACVGIEGRVVYVGEGYRPHYAERIVRNEGREYMTANMAYRRDALLDAGLFDESLRVYEDFELATRVMRFGRITFAPDMVVTHSQERYTVASYMREARHARVWLDYYAKTGDRERLRWRIYMPTKLLSLLFPLGVLAGRREARLNSRTDWGFLLLRYPRLWYERLLVWQWAVRHRQFII
ncbi:MAG: glycosyltransferase family 2 protein [Gemmatimonadaceae bacterium]